MSLPESLSGILNNLYSFLFGPVFEKTIQDATPFSPEMWLTSYASIFLIFFCPI